MRKAGLEPAWIAPLPPQDSVSANSTTSAITFVVETTKDFDLQDQERLLRRVVTLRQAQGEMLLATTYKGNLLCRVGRGEFDFGFVCRTGRRILRLALLGRILTRLLFLHRFLRLTGHGRFSCRVASRSGDHTRLGRHIRQSAAVDHKDNCEHRRGFR